jgi:hypothetical protein
MQCIDAAVLWREVAGPDQPNGGVGPDADRQQLLAADAATLEVRHRGDPLVAGAEDGCSTSHAEDRNRERRTLPAERGLQVARLAALRRAL